MALTMSMMDGDKINPAVTSDQQKLMEKLAEPAAEALLGLAKHFSTPIMARSKLHESLMAIRNIPLESAGMDHVDAGVQADMKPPEVQIQMNSKEANEWLEIAITALSANDHKKAEQVLTKFNNLYPSNQVKLILDKIHLKISRMSKSKENNIVEKFLDIAYKAIAAKDLKKALDVLKKAMEVKPTEKVQKLLHSVKQDIKKHETMVIECALTAINEDDYEVAEMLLQTAWIKYKSVHSYNTLTSCIDNENVHVTKYIVDKTDDQLKAIAKKYLVKAENLISVGRLEIAESFLIIASHTSSAADKGRIDKLLNEIHSTLYPNPNTVHPTFWYIMKGNYMFGNNLGNNIFEGPYTNDIQIYKCIYFLTMANRS